MDDENNIKDSSVKDSEIKESKIEDSKIEDSGIKESDIKDSQIKDSEIRDSHIEDSKIEDSKIVREHIHEDKKIGELFKKDEIKKYYSQTINFFKQKKVINIIIISFLLLLLIGGSWIRLQNLPLLKDSTTGKYIPLALDPFYFLRVAETRIEQGGLPAYDVMRGASAKVGFSKEIMPQAIIFLHKIGSIFDNDVTIQFIDVISPVIFFALALIVFFFLIYVLTKSKSIALISSGFLAIIPTYLYRTLAGFSDHEAIGMLAFFLTILCYGLALKFLDKEKIENQSKQEKKKIFIKIILWGLLVGFASAFTTASWGGAARFVFMIIPISFGLLWLIKVQHLKEINKKILPHFLIFYIIWVVSTILFMKIYGQDFSAILNIVVLSPNSFLTGAVFLFLIIDYILILNGKILKENLKKYRTLFSVLITIIFGAIFLSFFGTNILSMIPEIINKLLHPFGTSRVGLTVAENAQPYLMAWMGQISKIFFWIFYLGMIFVGINITKGIDKKKNKFLFSLFWTIMISGILFSRISASHLLNGVNFISKFVYFGGLILFAGYFLWLYFNEKIKIKSEVILIVSWLFITLIAARGAIRLFFVITPFVCFMVGYSTIKLFNYAKKSKEELLKLILFIALILVIIGLVISFFNFTTSTIQQAKYTGPSANYQWQNAMSWVRNNTNPGDTFVHWWDYGHWITYLGERPVITDGAHAVGFWDHLIGRYVLTTPKPETALSFMKSQNVSYLLIDSTDLGKYPAYSKIGSGEIGEDRFSQIPVMLSEQSQIQEIADGEIRVYQGGSFVDEDIIYELEGNQIFLPANKAGIAGVILENSKQGDLITFKQPEGVFVYNNQQIRIPLRYVYFNDELVDFGVGLDVVIKIISKISQTGEGVQIDNLGTAIYLSPKVSKSLFAQLYLLNDVFETYPTITLAHAEPDSAIKSLNSQGANLNEFVYFNGFRGPIKIWKIDYPSNILAKEEFLRTSGEYAEFDELEFVR